MFPFVRFSQLLRSLFPPNVAPIGDGPDNNNVMEPVPGPQQPFQEQHALSNQLILSNIFKYYGTRDLLNFRQVCKAWDALCLPELIRTVPLIVREGAEVAGDDYVVRLLSEAPPGTPCSKTSLAQILEYLDALSATSQQPTRYSTVVLQGWNLLTPSDGQKRFLREYGEGIEELHLIQCQLNENAFHDVVLGSARSVKSLTIDDRRFQFNAGYRMPAACSGRIHPSITSLTVLSNDYDSHNTRCSFKLWRDYLCGFSNLEKVVLSYIIPAVEEGENNEFLRLAQQLTSNSISLWAVLADINDPTRPIEKPKIKHLDITRLDWPGMLPMFSLAPEHRNHLRRTVAGMPQFPLTTLKINIGIIEETTGISIPELLQTFVTTLQTLVVIKPPVFDFPLPPLPNLRAPAFGFLEVMPHLQCLELIGKVTFNLDFLRFTPNLRKLRVTPMHRTKYFADLLSFSRDSEPFHGRHPQFMNLAVAAEGSNTGIVLPGLTDLELGYQLEGPRSIVLLTIWMPNVETLKIPATPEIFTVICREWGNSLRKLELQNPSPITDAVITGIRDGGSESVTWLRNLRSFTMEHPHYHLPFQCDHQIPRLTQWSILQGFARMEGLQNLRIFVTQQLGEECLQTLETLKPRMGVVTEVVGNCKCGRG